MRPPTDLLPERPGRDLPERLLLGSGPSPVPLRVLAALAHPTIGHMDPAFGDVMNDVSALLREAFVTDNAVTIPIAGTGSAGMETVVANLVEPGDRVVCGIAGLFGHRMADALRRHGADVTEVHAPWGYPIDPDALIAAVTADPAPSALFVVHGETSTGVVQPLDGLANAIHDRGGLLLVDCVTSLTGHPLRIDEAGIDAAFSGSQKCLNVPPGLAPLTLSPQAVERVRTRSGAVRSWYFDLGLALDYWRVDRDTSASRVYHHTAPTNMIVALREGLRLAVSDEWLATRWERHRRAHVALRNSCAALGLLPLASLEHALHPLLALCIPERIDEAVVRRRLLGEYDIEISGGLGPLAGRIWRIGIMGDGARPEPQHRLVDALARLLNRNPTEALDTLAQGWSA